MPAASYITRMRAILFHTRLDNIMFTLRQPPPQHREEPRAPKCLSVCAPVAANHQYQICMDASAFAWSAILVKYYGQQCRPDWP